MIFVLKIPNRIYLVIIAISMLITGYGFEADERETVGWTNIGMNILIIAGIFFLLKNGTFLHSTYFRWISACFSITILGALFKIMHWPFSGPMLIISMAGIPIIYGLHFYTKPIKETLDYVKLIWVLLFFLLRLAYMMHWYQNQDLLLVSSILFFLILVWVFNEGRKDPEWMNS
ncbi:MAG: GldL-related protein [Cytophagaceae bacterium]